MTAEKVEVCSPAKMSHGLWRELCHGRRTGLPMRAAMCSYFVEMTSY